MLSYVDGANQRLCCTLNYLKIEMLMCCRAATCIWL